MLPVIYVSAVAGATDHLGLELQFSPSHFKLMTKINDLLLKSDSFLRFNHHFFYLVIDFDRRIMNNHLDFGQVLVDFAATLPRNVDLGHCRQMQPLDFGVLRSLGFQTLHHHVICAFIEKMQN